MTSNDLAALDTIAAQLENPNLSETERTLLLGSGRWITTCYSCDPRKVDQAAKKPFEKDGGRREMGNPRLQY